MRVHKSPHQVWEPPSYSWGGGLVSVTWAIWKVGLIDTICTWSSQQLCQKWESVILKMFLHLFDIFTNTQGTFCDSAASEAFCLGLLNLISLMNLKVWKSLKVGKSRIKSESDLIFYQTFGKTSTSLMEMSWMLSQKGLLRVTIIVLKQIIILKCP